MRRELRNLAVTFVMFRFDGRLHNSAVNESRIVAPADQRSFSFRQPLPRGNSKSPIR